MTPRARRIVVPAVVALLVLAMVAFSFVSGRSRGPVAPASPPSAPAETTALETDEQAPAPPALPAGAPDASASDAPDDDVAHAAAQRAEDASIPEVGPPLTPGRLMARATARGESGFDRPAASIGGLDPDRHAFLIELSRSGAGIAGVTLSDVWETAGSRQQARRYRAAVAAGRTLPAPPPDEDRYRLLERRELRNARLPAGIDVPDLAANEITINGVRVNLLAFNRDEDGQRVDIWSELAPGHFETEVVDETGQVIARITRRYEISNSYDMTLRQRVENLSGSPLAIEWLQFGPGDLRVDRARYIDRRRFRFGYLVPARDPQRLYPTSDDSGLIFERATILKRPDVTIWPNRRVRDEGYELSWFGVTNRYFGFAVHPLIDEQGRGDRSLESVVSTIMFETGVPVSNTPELDRSSIFTYLASSELTVGPGESLALDLGVFLGPLDRHILDNESPYRFLAMGRLIVYVMSDWCAFCTFQWLAILLLNFLSFLHAKVLFDWGLAIIGLVLVVRLILHPITRKSQINMQRFGRRMSAMKPDIEKLQKKFKDDPKRMQQEQMRLFREHGVNPLHMLGCLPMLLQTPIWVALYAMLYFAFELRHEWAFFGVFQYVSGGAWPFLADLSSGDHFFGEFATPKQFLFWNLTGINLLPILMGGVFYVQQKYMTPPPSPTMTKEQLQQQKIMRFMFIFMLPIVLYSAPSGLTLYMLTSSVIGIIESRHIRAHLKDEDLTPKKPDPVGPGGSGGKGTKPTGRDLKSRAMRAALERAEERKQEKLRGKAPKFKRRPDR